MEKNLKIGDRIYSVVSDDEYLDAMGKEFEPHMVQLFETLIEKDDVVADIGANIGLTALLFSGLAKNVYAFEPSATTYRILSQNLAQNNVRNVNAVNLGLGFESEVLTITFARNNRSGGYVSNKIRPSIGHITEEIHIDTLDNYFTSVDYAPNFLKIDVEGFEQNVIMGGRNFLRRMTPTVVLEMNHFCLDVLQRITLPDFLDYMRSVFPRLYAVDVDNETIVDLHVPDQAYMVMHQHVVKQRFPNIVGGFDLKLRQKLDGLAASSRAVFAVSSSAPIPAPILSSPMGKIVIQTYVQQANVGDFFDIPVQVFNEGSEIWHGRGENPVVLSYHWKGQDGSCLIYDGVRTELQSENVLPGDTLTQTMKVKAPDRTGAYALVLTLVQEGVCWFEDRGFQIDSMDVAIG